MANRVQSSTGSDNARWRRESGGGNTDQPESDTFRGFADTRRTMKSSTMKGAEALASQPKQRRSRNGKNQIRTDKRALLYSTLRNQPRRFSGLETMARRESRAYLNGPDQKVLTDVTAMAMSQTNRARSEVAGVVSGAGQVCQCFKHLRLTRVLQVGQGEALTQLPSAFGQKRWVLFQQGS